jgi:hypothetical protein
MRASLLPLFTGYIIIAFAQNQLMVIIGRFITGLSCGFSAAASSVSMKSAPFRLGTFCIGKKPLGVPRRRWEDGIKMDFRETGSGGMDWIDLAQDEDQWSCHCEHGNEPSGSIRCWEILE